MFVYYLFLWFIVWAPGERELQEIVVMFLMEFGEGKWTAAKIKFLFSLNSLFFSELRVVIILAFTDV